MNNEKNIGKLMANGQWLMAVLILCTIHCPLFTLAQSQSWPEPKPEARPYTRWWWLGSAVNEADFVTISPNTGKPESEAWR